MEYHIMSDLHIDNWNTNLECKYPLGLRKNNPIKFEDNLDKILIIPGDISDDFDLSLDYLNNISKYYNKIIFIDGNHEHVSKYPSLYKKKDMIIKTNNYNNNKLIYLSKEPYVINNTVFIGNCGWWDYNKEKNINNYIDYFDNWIDFNEKDINLFHKNVLIKSLIEFYYLKEKLNNYQDNDNIKNIVIVTHTIPHKRFCKELLPNNIINDNYDCLLNSLFESINKKTYSKISHWIFGHVHCYYNEIIDGIHYICNPRGRVEDYDRVEYKPITIEI